METTTAMGTLISNVTTIVGAAVDWVGDYIGVIMEQGNEILLLFALVPLVGLGVGLIKRLMRVD